VPVERKHHPDSQPSSPLFEDAFDDEAELLAPDAGKEDRASLKLCCKDTELTLEDESEGAKRRDTMIVEKEQSITAVRRAC
jgi:hypothetical protein